MRSLCLVLLLSGCQAVKYLGAVPLEEYNAHIEEVERFSKEALENQGDIAGVAVKLAQENVIEAKSDGDDAKLDRAISTRVEAEMANKKANKLAETQFTKSEAPSFDWSNILSMLLTALGGAVPAGGVVAMLLNGKLNRVKEKAKTYASRPETFDISQDKDLR